MGARTSRAAVSVFLISLACLVPARALAQSETTEYYGLDTTGSVRVVFDAAGSVLARVDYGPFGEQLAPAPGAPNGKYAGLFRDDETGLDYAQARHYNPRTGRFTSLDPVYAGLFEPQRWNRYTYALNSPLSYNDPSGMTQVAVSCGAGPQWCPGNIQVGDHEYIHIDRQFDPLQYGYHGGEVDRAMNAWGDKLDSDFLATAIFGGSSGSAPDGGPEHVKVGVCGESRCGQVTNDYKDGQYKREEGLNKYEALRLYQIAVNADGALFGDRLYKTNTGVHITVNGDGSWTFDSGADKLAAGLAHYAFGKDEVGAYSYSTWTAPKDMGGNGHADWLYPGLRPPHRTVKRSVAQIDRQGITMTVKLDGAPRMNDKLPRCSGRWVSIALFVGSCLFSSGCVDGGDVAPGVTGDRVLALRPGMTYHDVVAAIGAPLQTQRGDSSTQAEDPMHGDVTLKYSRRTRAWAYPVLTILLHDGTVESIYVGRYSAFELDSERVYGYGAVLGEPIGDRERVKRLFSH